MEDFSFVRSPFAQWDVLPSFLVGELVFYALAITALVHAARSGRSHLLMFLGALLAGTANDLIFMALPLVDNFWHGQAMVMLTPRLPLYIPCVYISFMYIPAAAVRRLGWAPFPSAALTGLCSVLFYAPFDITGAKLLWWTWHDTDLPVASRILGAPASSTLWVLTFSGAYALLVHRALQGSFKGGDVGPVSNRRFAIGLLAVSGLATTLMVLQITPLQQLDGGAPGYIALFCGLAVYAAVAALFAGPRRAPPASSHDRVLVGVVALYAVALSVAIGLSSPRAHRSVGVHQTVGECGVMARDVTGLEREEFLCATGFDEPFELAPAPAEGAAWYAVIGTEDERRPARCAAVGGVGFASTLLLATLFGVFRKRKPAQRTTMV
ncbi:MAG: hypothetical protein AB8I08_24015 [Sandaracinaceae bacterium]